jgi:hypothetical protein
MTAWRGPSRPGEFATLGYAVADWVEKHLVRVGNEVVPIAGEPADGEAIILSAEQTRFLLWRYRLEPDGRRTYPRADLVPAEWTGEPPLNAVLAAAEAAGPVAFDGWDATGEPVGKPVW